MRMITNAEPSNKRSVNFDTLVERGIKLVQRKYRGSKTDATRMAVIEGLDKLVPGWRDGSSGLEPCGADSPRPYKGDES